jgi:hypothetical protein
MLTIERNFAHKSYGAIGAAVLAAPDGEYTLNGIALPESSVRHLLTFALQTLQDAYAGAKNADEALGAYNAKYDKLVNGTMGVRGTGSGLSERDRMARTIVGDWFRETYAKGTAERDKYNDADSAGRYAIIDKIWADNADAFGPAVDDAITAEKAKRAGLAKIKVSI